MVVAVKWARAIDTAVSIVLLGLAGYHFSTVSPTNASWRSGSIETTFGLLLLTAAYLLPRMGSVVVNGVLAAATAALGSYHFTHAGWRSGVTEWFLAIALAIAAVSIFKRST